MEFFLHHLSSAQVCFWNMAIRWCAIMVSSLFNCTTYFASYGRVQFSYYLCMLKW